MGLKQELIVHLSKIRTAPFLFIGSGMAMRYLGLPDWKGLLKHFVQHTPHSFEYYYSSANADLPQLATLLAADYHHMWWKDERFSESRINNKEQTIDEASALKIEISNFVKQKAFLSMKK